MEDYDLFNDIVEVIEWRIEGKVVAPSDVIKTLTEAINHVVEFHLINEEE